MVQSQMPRTPHIPDVEHARADGQDWVTENSVFPSRKSQVDQATRARCSQQTSRAAKACDNTISACLLMACSGRTPFLAGVEPSPSYHGACLDQRMLTEAHFASAAPRNEAR